MVPPETPASSNCTINGRFVVIAVECSEVHSIMAFHRVSSVAQVSNDIQIVPVCFVVHDERAVLGPVPVATTPCLQVKPHLVQTVLGQLMQQFVAEPVVAALAAESILEHRPPSTEVIGTFDVLMNQQRRAVVYISVKYSYTRNFS